MLLLVGALLAQIWAVKATVHIPLSAEWSRRRTKRIWIGVGLFVLGLGLMIGPIAAGLDESLLGPLIVIGILMMLVGIIFAVAAGNLVAATKITDNHIFMKGAKPAYLDTLPEWHGME